MSAQMVSLSDLFLRTPGAGLRPVLPPMKVQAK